MIKVFKITDISINQVYEDISNLDEVNKGDILIIHYKNIKHILNSQFTISNKNLIITDDEYVPEHHLQILQLNYSNYLPFNSKVNLIQVYLNEKLDIQLKTSNIEIIPKYNQIIIDDEIIKLSKKEMLVYEYLYKNKNELCMRSDILVNVLGYHADADTRIVDVYIKYLRSKLKDEGNKIETVRGKGYLYNV